MPLPVEFHPLAIAEARAARRQYVLVRAELAQRFMAEFDRVVEKIVAAPGQCSLYLHGMRFKRLHRFPYVIVFSESPGLVQIVAVAHRARRPGYWRKRLT